MDSVYFMFNIRTWRIKIGKSMDPVYRLHDVKRDVSDDLVLLGVILYDPAQHGHPHLEAQLHKQFSHLRIKRTEWFHATGELMDYVRDHRTHYGEVWEGEVEFNAQPGCVQRMNPQGETLWAVFKRIQAET